MEAHDWSIVQKNYLQKKIKECSILISKNIDSDIYLYKVNRIR